MIVLTSISPSHILGDIQNTAMLSWHDAGCKVYSLNSKEEVEILSPKYPFVTFIPDTQCYENQKLYTKPYISIASFFDFGETLSDDVIAIVNSDIHLRQNQRIFDKITEVVKACGFIIGKRYNYTNTFADARIEGAGVDFFCINRECLPCLPRTYQFVMGQCWWDYWLPTIVSKAGIPVYKIEGQFLYHKKHPLQWSQKLWYDLAAVFCRDTGYTMSHKHAQHISANIHDTFYNKAIPIR